MAWTAGRRSGSRSGRRAGAGRATACLALLVLAGCGSGDPAPLKAMPEEVPADLCAVVPPAARGGLVTDSSLDDRGTPTAACSLRSPVGSSDGVRALVTWLQSDDQYAADEVLASQCRAVDTSVFRNQSGFRATGADKACAASGTESGAGSVTIAAAAGRQVVTVRYTAQGQSAAEALTRGRQLLEGVLGGLAGQSGTTSG